MIKRDSETETQRDRETERQRKHAREKQRGIESARETEKQRGREVNILFNDALNTFYLRLYGARHMVKDHSDSERGNPAATTIWATLSD